MDQVPKQNTAKKNRKVSPEQLKSELEQARRQLADESALEAVRARSLEMHDSDELGEVAALLFEKLNSLGYLPGGARIYFSIIDADKKVTEAWMTREDGSVRPGPHLTPMNQEPALAESFRKWKKGDPLFVRDYSGKKLKVYLDFVAGLPHVKTDPDYQRLLASPPERFVMTDAFFRHGSVGVMTREPLGEDTLDILKRFAKAFQLTYTRFKDLQKAEAQAREAQIEAALEKVRSASMAMLHTSELQDVINVVGEQFETLAIDNTGGVFISINNEIDREIIIWGSGQTASYVNRVVVPYLDRPIYTGIVKRIKEGPGFKTETFSHEEKIEFFRHMFQYPPYNQTTKEHQEEWLSREGGYTRSCAISKHTSLFVINHHGRPFSDHENDILQRFARVFEQSYVRFLDLQKAEAQAREAQIEAALERVRARSMAMHQSNELHEVIQVLMDQFIQLGLRVNSANISLFTDDSGDWNFWSTSDGAIYPKPIHLPYKDIKVMRDQKNARRNGVDFFSAVYDKRSKNPFFLHVFKWIDNIPEERKKLVLDVPVMSVSTAYARHTGLYVGRYEAEPFTEAENQILSRFCKVFEQSYIRFLDLQQAEAQAREAQIEAALERVRARSMAMHQSSRTMWNSCTYPILTIPCSTVFTKRDKRRFPFWSML
jgi:plasmid maintenance system killer protein